MVDAALFELENVLFDTRGHRRQALRDACAAPGVGTRCVAVGATPGAERVR